MFINDSNVVNQIQNTDVVFTITTSFLLENDKVQANKKRKKGEERHKSD
jgi:hypothetical protein